MTTEIYGGTYARVMRQAEKYESKDDIEIHVWSDMIGNARHPGLVLSNLTEIKAFRDYLDNVIKQHPKYFKPRE